MGQFSDIVILCVGTNKIIGDSVGPIVGQKLTRLLQDKEKVAIYGTMKKTLNLKNARQVLEEVNNKYKMPFMITVDSALSKKELIEQVCVSTGMIQIGKSLGHDISYFSHINIKGIVGEDKKNLYENINTLNQVKRNCVHRLSNKIAYQVCQMVEAME